MSRVFVLILLTGCVGDPVVRSAPSPRPRVETPVDEIFIMDIAPTDHGSGRASPEDLISRNENR